MSSVLVERPKKTGQAKKKQKYRNKLNKKENSSLPAQVALQNLLLPPGVVPMAGGSVSRLGGQEDRPVYIQPKGEACEDEVSQSDGISPDGIAKAKAVSVVPPAHFKKDINVLGYYPNTFATAPAVGNAESTRTVSVSATDMSAECMSSVRGVDDHRDRQSMESQEVPYSGTTDCGGVSDTLPQDIIINDKAREAAATPPIKPVTTSCLVVPCPTMLLGGRSIDMQQSVQMEWQRICHSPSLKTN